MWMKLVGGALDGTMHDWHGAESQMLATVPEQMLESSAIGPAGCGAEMVTYSPRREVYRVRTIYADKERLHFAAPEAWSDGRALKHLLGIA